MINVIGIGQNRENITLGAIKAIEDSDVIKNVLLVESHILHTDIPLMT